VERGFSPEAVQPGAQVGIVFYVDSQPVAVTASVVSAHPFVMSSEDAGARQLQQGRRVMLLVQQGEHFAKAEAEIFAREQHSGEWQIVAGDFGWEEVDRRRYPRYELEIPVQMKAAIEKEGAVELSRFHGRTVDISVGGAWVDVDERPPQGSLVEFEAELAPGEFIRALCVVAWSETNKKGIGLEFLDFIGGSRYFLHTFLTRSAA
jgi:hypothetical protein